MGLVTIVNILTYGLFFIGFIVVLYLIAFILNKKWGNFESQCELEIQFLTFIIGVLFSGIIYLIASLL